VQYGAVSQDVHVLGTDPHLATEEGSAGVIERHPAAKHGVLGLGDGHEGRLGGVDRCSGCKQIEVSLEIRDDLQCFAFEHE
jgi:hypothetical protein